MTFFESSSRSSLEPSEICSKLLRPLHHAIIPSHYLRSHGVGFASLALSLFRANHLTAILRSGLTIGLIVARLGDGDGRAQHDHRIRADDGVMHIPISPVL